MPNAWNPMRDLLTLQDRMNHLFEDAAVRQHRGAGEDEEAMDRADWQPAADVYEAAGEFVIALDLPGVRRDALNVSLDQDRLTISGERAKEGEVGVQQRRAERPAGRFARSFTLPPSIDRARIAAEYQDGVLRLRLPKRAEQQPRRVEIKVQ